MKRQVYPPSERCPFACQLSSREDIFLHRVAKKGIAHGFTVGKMVALTWAQNIVLSGHYILDCVLPPLGNSGLCLAGTHWKLQLGCLS